MNPDMMKSGFIHSKTFVELLLFSILIAVLCSFEIWLDTIQYYKIVVFLIGIHSIKG